MPTVSTKLSRADYDILRNQAQAQGDSVSAYVRKQLRPKITSQKPEPPRSNDVPVAKIKGIVQ